MLLHRKIVLTIVLKFMVYCALCSPSPGHVRPPRNHVDKQIETMYFMRPPSLPPPPEPSFIQRIVSWIYPFGGGVEEQKQQQQQHHQQHHQQKPSQLQNYVVRGGHHGGLKDSEPAPSDNIDNSIVLKNRLGQIRDIEPTTPRSSIGTDTNVTPMRCHPCNKFPWIPMMPTYQLPILNNNDNNQGGPYPASIGFKHHFGDDKPYNTISPPAQNNFVGYNYPVNPVSTQDPASVTPLKIVGYNYPSQQVDSNPAQSYGVPNVSPAPQYGVPAKEYGPPVTTPAAIYGVPAKEYGPPQTTPAAVYGLPAKEYGPPQTTPAKIYGLPANEYGAPITTPAPIYGVPVDNIAPPSTNYGVPGSVGPLKLQAIPNQQNFNRPQSYNQVPIKQQTNLNQPQSYYQNPVKQQNLPQSYYQNPVKQQNFPQSYYQNPIKQQENIPQSYYQNQNPIKQTNFNQPVSYYQNPVNQQGGPYSAAPPIRQQQGGYVGPDNSNVPITTVQTNLNTIDTSVILLTTPPPNGQRPAKFTLPGSVTNSEYIPPPNVLPLENESANYAPIPIPNLSATPIPPLYNAQSFLTNPYLRPNPNPIINFVPFHRDSLPQLSNTVNVQAFPNSSESGRVEQARESLVEIVKSVPLVEFSTSVPEFQDNLNNRFITSQPVFRVTDIDLDSQNEISHNNDTNLELPSIVHEIFSDNIGAGSETEIEQKVNTYGGFHNNNENDKNNEIIEDERLNFNEDAVPQESSIVYPNKNSNLEVLTTTENNVIVEFEPSLQTAADYVERIKEKTRLSDLNRIQGNNPPFVSIRSTELPPFKPLREDVTSLFSALTTPSTTRTTTTRPPTTTTEASLFQPLKDLTKKVTQLWGTSILPFATTETPKIRMSTQPPYTTTPIVTSTQFVPDYTRQLSKLWTTRSTPSPTTLRMTTQPPTTVKPETSSLSFISTVLPKATTIQENVEASGIFTGITPPLKPSRSPSSTKKPKQIQIIIPYTTYHKPSPFKIPDEADEPLTYPNGIPIRGHYITHPQNQIKNSEERNDLQEEKEEQQEESMKTELVIIHEAKQPNNSQEDMYNAHGYQGFHNDQEYDHAQESQIIESKVTTKPTKYKPTRKMTPYIPIYRSSTTTKAPKYITKILATNIRDLLKKERTPKPNRIDIIRLQKNIDGWTEQSFSGKASTISMLGHTKKIPKAFLTTTISPLAMATTLSTLTTFNADLMEETKRQYERILYKNEEDENLIMNPNSVKRNDISRFLDKNHDIVLFNNNLTYDGNEGVEIYTPRPTIPMGELWKNLVLTESPLTREKIYVVTPQPLTPLNGRRFQNFKSPRFSIRPTPATGVYQQLSKRYPKKSSRIEIKPDLFGHMDDDMDLMEVETNDGHSNVVRIITPTKQLSTVPLNPPISSTQPPKS